MFKRFKRPLTKLTSIYKDIRSCIVDLKNVYGWKHVECISYLPGVCIMDFDWVRHLILCYYFQRLIHNPKMSAIELT